MFFKSQFCRKVDDTTWEVPLRDLNVYADDVLRSRPTTHDVLSHNGVKATMSGNSASQVIVYTIPEHDGEKECKWQLKFIRNTSTTFYRIELIVLRGAGWHTLNVVGV